MDRAVRCVGILVRRARRRTSILAFESTAGTQPRRDASTPGAAVITTAATAATPTETTKPQASGRRGGITTWGCAPNPRRTLAGTASSTRGYAPNPRQALAGAPCPAPCLPGPPCGPGDDHQVPVVPLPDGVVRRSHLWNAVQAGCIATRRSRTHNRCNRSNANWDYQAPSKWPVRRHYHLGLRPKPPADASGDGFINSGLRPKPPASTSGGPYAPRRACRARRAGLATTTRCPSSPFLTALFVAHICGTQSRRDASPPGAAVITTAATAATPTGTTKPQASGRRGARLARREEGRGRTRP